MTMRTLILVVVLGCGGKQEASPQPISNVSTTQPEGPPKTRDQIALEAMSRFRDDMCKCAEGDADCAKRVSDDMVKWAENQPKDPAPQPMKADPAAEKIGMEMGECMTKAMMPLLDDAGPGP
ncbi:MAG TPA: hypothetical protein VIU61_20440 [Kofleriaceae bacterium]